MEDELILFDKEPEKPKEIQDKYLLIPKFYYILSFASAFF